MESHYKIGGMTCENCVKHVTNAFQGLFGVRNVQVDLETGSARIEHDVALERDSVASALSLEGYDLLSL